MKDEENISRKFAIAVVTILVIILVTNNFSDLTGQATMSRKSVVTGCYDSDDKVYDNGGWNIYKGGSASGNRYGSFVTYTDTCSPDSFWVNSYTLMEAYCKGGYPTIESANCPNGCVRNRNGAYCKQASITQAQKKAKK